MSLIKTSTRVQAEAMLNLVKEFSPDAQLVLDPSSGQEFGDNKRDDDLGMVIIPPVPEMEEGPFCIYGHVAGPKLAIPVLDRNSKDYTIFASLNAVYIQNVGEFVNTYNELEKKASSGHPLYQNGIKFGKNIVARGDDGNKVVVLLWSAHKYNERQELA